MTDDTTPEVVAALEDDTGDRTVDVLRHPDGQFSYVEYHRDGPESDEWRQVEDAKAKTYATQFAAYTAATRTVDWLMD